LWGGAEATADPMAWNFISFLYAYFLNELLPQGLITRSESGCETTMDLVFSFPPLKNSLESFRVKKDLTRGLTIYPSFLSFLLCHNYASLSHVHYGRKQMRKPSKKKQKKLAHFLGILHVFVILIFLLTFKFHG
jgi:succinate-acetate transporter protein